MSKHHHKDECCYPMTMGYSMGGYSGGTGCGGGWVGLRWFYALLILIVIVLQFGRRNFNCQIQNTNLCDGDGTCVAKPGCDGFFGNNCNNDIIDRSVLFIIVVFLLVICAGCSWGGCSGGSGYGGGYGYY